MARTEEQFKKLVGKRLATAQRLSGKSDRELLDEMGFSPTELKLYKNGLRTPSFYRVVALADYLNVSLDYLTGKSESSMPAA